MDILTRPFRSFVECVGGFRPDTFGLVFRLLLVLGLALICARHVFQLGNRSPFVQWAAALCGVLAGFLIPVTLFPRLSAVVLACLLLFGLLCVAGAPFHLPFFLTARYDRQLQLRRALLALIAFLAVLQGCRCLFA